MAELKTEEEKSLELLENLTLLGREVESLWHTANALKKVADAVQGKSWGLVQRFDKVKEGIKK
jgi:hypothetical protein